MHRGLSSGPDAILAAIPPALLEAAEDFTANRACPIDVLAILRELGTGLVFSTSRLSSGHAGALRFRDNAWEIVVYRPVGKQFSPRLTPRERFTVAHELAHLIIETRFVFRPSSRGAYWRLEQICNDFAARLLVPASALDEALHPEPNSALKLLSSIQRLRTRTVVSFEVASRRLVEAIPCPASVAGLAFGDDLAGVSRRSIRWVHENRKWMGGGRNRKINSEHPFSMALDMAHGLLAGQVRTLSLEGADSTCLIRGHDDAVFLVSVLKE